MKNTMKKWIALICSFLFVLLMCSCSGGEQKKDPNTTELTLENYSKYIKLSTSVYTSTDWDDMLGVGGLFPGGYGMPVPGGSTLYVYKKIQVSAKAEAASTNYDYNDVEFTVRFSGTYKNITDIKTAQTKEENFDETVTFTLDIGGSGSGFERFPVKNYTHEKLLDINAEVIEVKGSVTKATAN